MAAVIEPMERALAKLSMLRRALGRFEQHLEWHPQDESSDPLSRIEQLACKTTAEPQRR